MYCICQSRVVPSALASSVCWSLQCLISALTKRCGGGHFLRLTCSLVLWGGRNTANKYHWRVWRVLPVSQAHWVCPRSMACVLSQSTLFRVLVALRGTIRGKPSFACTSQVRAAQVTVCLASTVTPTYCLSCPCCSVFWVYNRCAFSGGY